MLQDIIAMPTHQEIFNSKYQKKLNVTECTKCGRVGKAALEAHEDINGKVLGWFCWCQCRFITPVKKTQRLAVKAFEFGELDHTMLF